MISAAGVDVTDAFAAARRPARRSRRRPRTRRQRTRGARQRAGTGPAVGDADAGQPPRDRRPGLLRSAHPAVLHRLRQPLEPRGRRRGLPCRRSRRELPLPDDVRDDRRRFRRTAPRPADLATTTRRRRDGALCRPGRTRDDQPCGLRDGDAAEPGTAEPTPWAGRPGGTAARLHVRRRAAASATRRATPPEASTTTCCSARAMRSRPRRSTSTQELQRRHVRRDGDDGQGARDRDSARRLHDRLGRLGGTMQQCCCRRTTRASSTASWVRSAIPTSAPRRSADTTARLQNFWNSPAGAGWTEEQKMAVTGTRSRAPASDSPSRRRR